jgi:poly(A) polymerase
MFYDPLQEKILDYVNGREDLEKKIIRAIGNPHDRIHEDRLRMIRAVRLACRFNFTIEQKTEEAIRFHAKELFPAVAIERIWQEFTKGHAFFKLAEMLNCLHKFGLLSSVFPVLETVSTEEVGMLLEEIKYYPKEAPVIASLLPLFPQFTLNEQLDLCKKLKLPNGDLQFVTFFSHLKKLIQQKENVERYDWAYAYANPLADLCLNILLGKQPALMKNHTKRKEELKDAISRIEQKNPLVKSSDLIQEGILPGKNMGLLLKEAEKIAINEQINDPNAVLSRLKSSSLWPKEPL